MPERWLAGPVGGVPPELMPVAHALLNASEQIEAAISGLTSAEVVARPRGIASIAFHVTHAAGSLDRLFTYARGESLADAQRAALAAEARVDESSIDGDGLIAVFRDAVERSVAQVRATDPGTLGDPREVGRAKLPSSVLGLLFHGAEHTARHCGQIVTTARLVRSGALTAKR